ncbi:hypothetical protein [Phyllobacterium zundukense]|uniref:Uncharacterized protein n=1 Tax=Phyllobacterium zundukense TaxID=1867719 RepID=A0A2N9VTR6_9HYPH|nr:hypothetical protein [Phyllobacterium zundukense]ATU93168.1 hypothetical protein BLM14_17300 [Phyllobacterium zundukense]PIO42884.1 hypothetical protein B5P45_20790 [Phyllobacterium zundukense]
MTPAPSEASNPVRNVAMFIALQFRSSWFQGIFTSLMGRGLAEVEQAILTFMRSDAFLGSKWTPGELHFFLYETLFGRCEDADHAWKSRALEASIRRGLASLQHKGFVKKHTVSRQGWLGLPPEIKWSLGDAEMNNAEIKARKHVRKQQPAAPSASLR